ERAARLAAAVEGGAGARAVRVGDVALRLVPGTAVRAVATRDGRRHDDALALPQVAHVLADLLNHADRLVPEDGAGLHARERAADEMQVGAADRARRDADQRIGRLLQPRIAHRLEPD